MVQRKEVTGKVSFELEMNQQLKDFTYLFRDVSIHGLTVQGSEALVYLEYCFSEEYGGASFLSLFFFLCF